MMSLLSKALSAISAPNSIPSMSGGTPMVSKRCPGSRTNRTRLPRASVRGEDFGRHAALGLADGGVDHGVPLEDGVPRTEQRRQIAPWAAGSRDPQHRLDKAPVILTAATGVGLLPKAMRLHFRPLGI